LRKEKTLADNAFLIFSAGESRVEIKVYGEKMILTMQAIEFEFPAEELMRR
jgi:hypothetical protein